MYFMQIIQEFFFSIFFITITENMKIIIVVRAYTRYTIINCILLMLFTYIFFVHMYTYVKIIILKTLHYVKCDEKMMIFVREIKLD